MCSGVLESARKPLAAAAAAAVRPRKVGTHETPRQLWREKGKRRKRNVDREEEEEKKTTTSCCCCTAHGGGAPTGPRTTTVVCVWVYSNIWSLKKRVESKTRWRFFYIPDRTSFGCLPVVYIFTFCLVGRLLSILDHATRIIHEELKNFEGHRRENEREPFSKLPTLERIQLPYY